MKFIIRNILDSCLIWLFLSIFSDTIRRNHSSEEVEAVSHSNTNNVTDGMRKDGGDDGMDKDDNNYSSGDDSGFADDQKDGHSSARSSNSGLTAIPE